MYQKLKRAAALVLTCLCLINVPLETWAATKPINSVSIKLSSKLNVGSPLPQIQIGSGSAPDGGILVTEKGSHFTVAEASWVDTGSKEVKAADEPRMRLVLEPDDVSEYYFLVNTCVVGIEEGDEKIDS